MEPIYKMFKLDAKGLDLKKLDAGMLSVVFATMNVMDKDGDITLPGFFGVQDVALLPCHDWSHVPIGKGVTREEGDKAVADFQMNLEIPAAKEWLSHIKFDLAHGKPLQEYSYGFKILAGGSRMGETDGKTARYLTPREDGTPGCKIWEVSTVLVGAGENTGTLSAKASGSNGNKFCDEIEAALDAAESVAVRAKSLADLRAEHGREISQANKEKLVLLAGSLQKAAMTLVSVAAPAVAEKESLAKPELVRMLKLRAGIK
jgi:hypothetical protein